MDVLKLLTVGSPGLFICGWIRVWRKRDFLQERVISYAGLNIREEFFFEHEVTLIGLLFSFLFF